MAHPLDPYAALVLLSFGGPEAPDQVLPFLRRVTAGRGIPEHRLAEVADHYYHFGGVSPINAQNRALVAALEDELERRGAARPVLLANRHTDPLVEDVLAAAPGPVLTILTSAYQSYSSCRQYREDLARGPAALEIDKIPAYAAHPAFRDTVARLAAATLADARAAGASAIRVLTVAHSIPVDMDAGSGAPGEGSAYSRALAQITDELGARLGSPAELTYCSRSGPPVMPWLEPDVGDRVEELAAQGVDAVLLVPVGFVSDHMEVRYDLDTEVRQRAEAAGIRLWRAPTVGTDPAFVAGLVDLALARAAQARGESDPDPRLPAPICPAGCCPNPRGSRPARCGEEEAP